MSVLLCRHKTHKSTDIVLKQHKSGDIVDGREKTTTVGMDFHPLSIVFDILWETCTNTGTIDETRMESGKRCAEI
jgi:hypothetical protein